MTKALFVILGLMLLGGCRAMPAVEFEGRMLKLYDLQSGETLSGLNARERLANERIVLVGEHHTDRSHHQAQLAVIQSLFQSGRPLAVGLEMFRIDSQGALDRWVAGQVDEAQFRSTYLDNWNFDWSLYRPIFMFCRDHGIPMVALNVDPAISRQVAYHGVDSLTPAQMKRLGDLQCDVTPAYRDYIREAFGEHGHGHMQFENFCQAQMLWDSAMAAHALAFLKERADITMVILAGSGHAQKPAIPAQIEKRGPWSPIVILPQTQGVYDADHTTPEDADYLFVF